jgi:hypothetical protein
LTGFVPRSGPEVARLIEPAYGADGDPTRLKSSLGVIARALNAGDLARAMTAAVLTRTPELSGEAAARLAKSEERLAKFNPHEPRDWHGRWTSGGIVGPAIAAAPGEERAAGPGVALSGSDVSNPEHSGAERRALLTPVAAVTEDEVDDDDSREPTSPEQAFERKYDGLGPVEFAKQVIQFGDRSGREGKTLSPADKEHALAEYSFLQDRLSRWLAYDYKSAAAEANLLSAALTLYQGAVDGGIVGPDHMPESMVDVGGAVWAFDNFPPGIRRPTRPEVDIEPAAPTEALTAIEALDEIVDNNEVGIKWDEGIKDQGGPWEIYRSE